MGTPSSDNLMLGQGHLFFDRFDLSTGVPVSTGLRHLGNCSEFSLGITNEKAEKMTSMYSVRRVYKQVIRQTKTTGKIKVDEFTPDNLAMAMLGEKLQYVQTNASYAGAGALVVPPPQQQDRYLRLPDRWLNPAGFILADNTTNTPYVAGTDYVLDDVRGRVYIVPGGAIPVGTGANKLKITYSTKDVTAADNVVEVIGATKPSVEGKLVFVGDPVHGPVYYAEFWHVSMTPEGDMGLIGEDFANFGLNFSCKDKRAQYPTEPFYRILQVK